MKNTTEFTHIPKDMFAFVNHGERISDKKFEDKPIGYFKDAWIRFCKNKAAIVAAIIILCILAFAVVAPLAITTHNATFMDTYYSRKPPRNALLSNNGIADSGTNRGFSAPGNGKAGA